MSLTEEQLRQQAADQYGVNLDESLSRQEIIGWLERQQTRTSLPPAGPRLRTITPRGGDVQSITGQSFIIKAREDPIREREQPRIHRLPPITTPLPPREMTTPKDEVFVTTGRGVVNLEEEVSSKTLFTNANADPEDAIETPDYDVFNFEFYEEDFLKFSQFFEGVELYLRNAIWNQYKYEYIDTTINNDPAIEEDRDIKAEEKREELEARYAAADDKKKFLEDMTDVFEPRDLLIRWYYHFNPEKLDEERNDIPIIDDFLEEYVGHLDTLFNDLYRKYVNEDAPRDARLWFNIPEEPKPKRPQLTVEVPARTGLIEKIQDGAAYARKINPQASFQPKTAFAPAPQLPRTKARIVPGTPEKVTGTRGITLTKIGTPTTQRPIPEMSRSAVPTKTTTTPVPTKTTTTPTTPRGTAITTPEDLLLTLDVSRLTTERGSYTVAQLQDFLSRLGLKKSGTKPELIDRLSIALGL